MKSIALSATMALTVICVISCQGPSQNQKVHYVTPDRQWSADSAACVIDTVTGQPSPLQDAIDAVDDGDTVILQTGIYCASPRPFTEPLCGNCLEHGTKVNASIGFMVSSKSVTIIGVHKDSTILVTGAGYGVYFERSPESRLERLKVTGGRRDLDGNATDAAIVVRESRVHLGCCALADNTHRQDSVVVGIGGVFGREGAEIFVSDCDIINNGWDGMALYRGASAVITDCIIQTGRGAGIGVTWDAHCVARRNDISGYWKGIGSFGTSTVIAHNNLVHDNLGWGIIATGESYMDATNNIVHHNGNCGVAPWSQECGGRFVNNVITQNGWREEWVCPCVGVWNYGDLKKWRFLNNIIWGNEAGDFKDMPSIIGDNGNISADPMFVGDEDFRLRPESPAIDAGYEEITDHDGSPSDLGIYGGTSAPGKAAGQR